MDILFTICGRAGSKGFKNKNLKEMNGVPLVFYTLATICLYMDLHPENLVNVAVNTDSQPLMDLIRRQGALSDVQFIERKAELAGDKVAKVDVIKDTYHLLDKAYDAVIDLDITSPLRMVADVENIIDVYRSNGCYELVVSVAPARRSPYFNMVEKKKDFYRKICESNFATRQETPEAFELNASIYAYRPSFLDTDFSDSILDHRCGISIMKDYLVLDIDSEEDFQMMETLHRHYIKHEDGIREVFEYAKKFVV